jgi:uncharacterized protein YbaR (Trm112 family)
MTPEVLRLLACPSCSGSLREDRQGHLVCDRDALAFPIADGIAMLVIERGVPLGEAAEPVS